VITGLSVCDLHHPDRAAVRVVEIGWNSPPPVGASWTCCRRARVPAAEVASVEWAGLDGDADVWVQMRGSGWLLGHLIDKHGFGEHYL